MSVNTVSQASLNIDSMLATRAQLDNLQRQLGTGQRADNYADLGAARSTSLTFRGQSAALTGFQNAIEQTEVDLSILSETLERLDAIADEMKGDALPTSFVIQNGDRTTAQVSAEFRFYEAVTLLNTDVEGQFFFSGLSSDTRPVADADDIMDGAAGQAGFKQVLAERQLADLGGSMSDATLTGRLDLATVGTAVSITETGGDVFGFQLDTAAGASSSSANIAVTGPAGSPQALSFDVTGAVNAGETVRFAVTMPDGTEESITLTAAESAGAEANTFVVDADPTITAGNLGSAIESALDKLARTQLSAASAAQAGTDFFDNNPPLRVVPDAVDGIAGATGLVADPTDTVIWYQGENGPLDARLTNTTRVDDGVQVAYGARANEDGLRTTLRELAVFSAQTFDVDDDSSAERYTQMALRTRGSLDDASGATLPRSVALEVATAGNMMQATKDRHIATQAIFSDILDDTDGISQEEVAAQLLTIQTRLEASYSVTALLRELTLVNFL